MKNLIIIALIVVSISSFAQKNTGTKNNTLKVPNEMKSPEERNDARLKKMSSDLNLDVNQQAQMKFIIMEQNSMMEARKAERMANKDNDSKPTKEEREAMKTKRVAEKTAIDDKIKKVLNATQYDKYKVMEETNRAKMQEQRNERGNKDRDKVGEQ
jgi:periplasmic protein CpxP/Spy